MAPYQSSLLQTLKERGFIYQCTDIEELDRIATKGKPLIAYTGFDATAPALHVGSLLQIMTLRHLQQHGHKPLILVGGGTTKIGDPSGRDTSRQLMDEETINHNIQGITANLKKFIKFGDGPQDAILVNNDDWLGQLNYLTFLRDYGPHFTINRMLTLDSVRLRLERQQPLTFLEFNYMILQAYDFVELHKKYGCLLQLGGSDQWGNIVTGIDLARRFLQKDLFGLTTPLVTTSDGKKMGKTAQGAVWIDEKLRSPYEYWQFWRNTKDEDVERFLLLFTELPIAEIKKLAAAHGAEINDVKRLLADEATRLAHGQECLAAIHKTVNAVFNKDDHSLASSLPVHRLAPQVLPLSIIDAFLALQLVDSKSEARRLIKGGGARVNDIAVKEETLLLTKDSFGAEQELRLSVGRKRHGLLKLTEE